MDQFVIEPKKYPGATAVVSARLPKTMIQKIDDVAEGTGHNRNEVITLCLEFAIDNLDAGAGKHGDQGRKKGKS